LKTSNFAILNLTAGRRGLQKNVVFQKRLTQSSKNLTCLFKILCRKWWNQNFMDLKQMSTLKGSTPLIQSCATVSPNLSTTIVPLWR